MPKYTVSIEMDFYADDEDHAAALAYRALLREPLPLYYSVSNGAGGRRDIVVNRKAVEEFGVADDFVKFEAHSVQR